MLKTRCHTEPVSPKAVIQGCADHGHQKISGNREDKQEFWPKRPQVLFLEHFKPGLCLTTSGSPRTLTWEGESEQLVRHAWHRSLWARPLLAARGTPVCNTGLLGGGSVPVTPSPLFH